MDKKKNKYTWDDLFKCYDKILKPASEEMKKKGINSLHMWGEIDKEGKLTNPNFVILSRLGLTPSKLIENTACTWMRKKDIIRFIIDYGFNEMESVSLKDYKYSYFYKRIKNTDENRGCFRVFERNGNEVVTERIYVYSGETPIAINPPPYNNFYDPHNRVELIYNEKKLDMLISKFKTLVRELEKRQTSYRKKVHENRSKEIIQKEWSQLSNQLRKIEHLTRNEYGDFFEIITEANCPVSFEGACVRFRIDGCKTKNQYKKLLNIIELWGDYLYGSNELYKLKVGRRIKWTAKLKEKILSKYEEIKKHDKEIKKELNAIKKDKGLITDFDMKKIARTVGIGDWKYAEKIAYQDNTSVAVEEIKRIHNIDISVAMLLKFQKEKRKMT